MGIVLPAPSRIEPLHLAMNLVANLKALRRADRDPHPGEWFRLARRFVAIRRWTRTGRSPFLPTRSGSAIRPLPPVQRTFRA